MKMETFEKARALGEEIANSPEFHDLQKAQAVFEADKEARDRAYRLDALREEMDVAEQEFVTLAQLERIREEVDSLRKEMDESRSIMALEDAQAAFTALMEEVNQAVRFVISGEAVGPYHMSSGDRRGYRQVH